LSNKRIAALVTEIFLDINGMELVAGDDQLYVLYMKIAAGSLGRDEFEERFRSWSSAI
jgi:prophage maintenance system killer protein